LREGYVLVVTPDRDAAPTVLFFGGLGVTRGRRIRIAQYRRDAMITGLGGATAVLFVRGLFEFEGLVSLARRLGIPRYYFVDDHLMIIRDQGGDAAAFARDHTQEAVTGMVADFAGVLVSTVPLMNDFRARAIHPQLELFPPTAIPAVPCSRDDGAVTIGFFGGSHLHQILKTAIVPAVRDLAASRPVTLVVVGAKEAIGASPGLTVLQLPYQSYLDGVRALGRAGVTVLAHPVAPGLPGNAFKNPHALITAGALGAVPVVSDAPPYSTLRHRGIAVLCGEDPRSWYGGLTSAVQESAAIVPRLIAYCSTEFSGHTNARVWDAILADYPPPSALAAATRSAVTAAALSAGWIGRVARRGATS